MTRFEEMGGDAALRPLIADFVDRCFEDTMIGFFFRAANRDRIKALEYQHAAEWLGREIRYRGRALDDAHRPHSIMGGQFARRLQILREVLDAHGVPPHIRDAWIAHQESLRPLITHMKGSECR